MAIPKEPRQQMINIMYLVLTALLALNVSAEVINAFKKVNDSLSNSTNNIILKNNDTYQALADKVSKEKTEQAEDYQNRALQAKQISQDFYDYIGSIKGDIEEYVGRDEEGNMKKLDDLNASTVVMLGRDNAGGHAQELRQKINETRAKLMALIPEDRKEEFGEQNISLEEAPEQVSVRGEQKPWERANFESIPAIAAMTNLTKLQSDVKTSEANLVTYLSTAIGAKKMKFDAFKVGVVPNSTYLLAGEELEVEAFLAAYSSESNNVTINIGGTNVPLKDGVATWKRRVSGIGEKTLPVTINLYNPATDKTETIRDELKYKVGSQATTVSAAKMNVIFIGLDNPIEIGVSGVNPEDVSASISGSGATLTGGRGNYTARATSQGKATVSVTAKGKSAGTKEFRVMRVPDPVAKVGGKVDGAIKSAVLKAQKGIQAELKDFYFEGVRYNVVSYNFVLAPKRKDIQTAAGSGGSFTGQVANLLSQVKPGDAVWFENIRAKGPDGQTRKLNSVVFKVQ